MPDTRHLPEKIPVDATRLNELICTSYGIRPISITPLGGYSNLNYALTTESGIQYVLRIARSNRSPVSLMAERHVLLSLEKAGYNLAPRIISPIESPMQDVAIAIPGFPRSIQLSQMIPGTIDCLWWQQCSFDKVEQIFSALSHLHQLMAQIPLLQQRQAPYQYELPEQPPVILQATATGQYVLDNWQKFRQAATRLQMDIAVNYPWEKARYQWIHGDIQLENLLFHQDQLTGFLDFERVSYDACEKDLIFSAFRVCKEGNTDAAFTYDSMRFAASIKAYRISDSGLCPFFFNNYEKYWKPFFCLDQAMVYLENAFDGTWQLAEGIGFLPCFNEVLDYPGA
jgi:Ser/Thr protein kinase RdoA (MazF antagonist)